MGRISRYNDIILRIYGEIIVSRYFLIISRLCEVENA